MNVLYVNHTGKVSGGERSLLDLLRALPADVSPCVATPDGELGAVARQLGVPVVPIHGTEASLRLHPLHTTTRLASLLRSAVQVRRAASAHRAALIHANSTRAGLVAAIATRLGAPPAVVHVRDCLPSGRAAQATRKMIGSGAAAVIANSRYTAQCFGAARGRPLRVVHNAVDLGRFNPERLSKAEARSRLGFPDAGVLLGVVAQLTPWKAQDDAIRILGLLREEHPDAQLLLVGEAKFTSSATRYDNLAFEQSLRELAGQLGLAARVCFLGEHDDAPVVLRALDILLVPSWEEPFGRTVLEAMAMETPVAATDVGGPAEIVTDGRDGLLLPPRAPDRWADTLRVLLADNARRAGMAANARRTVEERFTIAAHVEEILRIYGEVIRGDGDARQAVRRTSSSRVRRKRDGGA